MKIGFQKTSPYSKGISKKEKATTIITVFLGLRGGGKKTVPADTVDTLRGGREETLNKKLWEKTRATLFGCNLNSQSFIL